MRHEMTCKISLLPRESGGMVCLGLIFFLLPDQDHWHDVYPFFMIVHILGRENGKVLNT